MALTATTAKAQKIGLLMADYINDRWRYDQKFFIEKVKELGGEVIVESANGDAAEQVALGKKLIASGIQVLVIVPVDGKKAAEIVNAAKLANIPVVSYDRLIISKDLSFYISFNGVKVGNLQAEYAMNKVPKGNYLLLNGPTVDNNAILIKMGQLSVLQPGINSGDVKIIGDFVLNDWGEIEALMKVNDFLSSSNERPDAIIAANDAIATGAIQSLPEDLRGKVVVTGQDAELMAIRNIVAGNQSMTVYKPIKQLAYQAAEVAMKLARKQEISNKTKLKNGNFEIDVILLNPSVIDKDNYKETVIKDGHISAADLEKK
jgi:D-xylose transport system substrate-binding protein